MKIDFNLKNKLDLLILLTALLWVFTGAFLRFFKYLFKPETLETLSYLLIIEFIILATLFLYKIWRQ
ncbi:hypothetical protein FE773_01165 [Caminibacter mediatlanticus TB-2]|uniref:Uncharacterized protein n=1 Tax=Caminibacter mediatlanticus TB-2 TaxID=391592 RepID=A0ABX5V8Z4_9BACT|nr:hypothetical protein [Caminibacter mediatlanticus]QCT93837.1 hypothetical protein FE773_01165 [Caminibacter mediatlanticus TB-2]